MKKNFNSYLSLLCCVLFPFAAFSQYKPKLKFGDVKAEDFAPAFYPLDSSAGAVYLLDDGNTYFEGNTNGTFNVIFQHHAKIRLLKKSAFDDIATVKIPLIQTNNYEQSVQDMKVSTYNLEGDKIVTTKLEKSSIFKDKNGNLVTMKFTFPNIKEGSIIEYSYKISYPGYYYIPSWEFQDQYPRLLTQYSVEIPEFYDFAFLQQGYIPFTVDSVNLSRQTFTVIEQGNTAYSSISSATFSANTVLHFWTINNVVPLKEEGYTTTLDNYISRIQFELSAVRYPNAPVRFVLKDWFQVAQDLMKDEDFGESLSHDNNWVKDDVKKETLGLSTDLEKAKAIYKFVRDNYDCTDNSARYLSQPVKKTYQTKKGNVVDINMLLAVMLQNAGYEVHPVFLSTRRHGKPVDVYPLINKFNYVITQVKIADSYYLLDASNSNVAFGKLPSKCYNGNARLISPDSPTLIPLSADSLKEANLTSVFVMNADKGMAASYSSSLGDVGSIEIRDDLSTTDKKDDFFKNIKKDYLFDVNISNAKVDSLKTLEFPVTVKYDFKFDLDDDLVYFNPLLSEQVKENPFKSADRFYPVEMPYCQDAVYVLNMEIPKGYKVEELPKSARVMLNDNEGMFEYIIGASADRIQLRCRTQIKKANFTPDDYQTLRDFYTYIVKKEAEQIVFKKN